MWLPKGIALDHLGLDKGLFTSTPTVRTFTSPDYPWWWSILGNVDARAAGAIDLRALNGQLALLLAGFIAAAARLLWGRVRPSLLWCGLVLLALAPELLRLTQSGGADAALAIYVALFAAAGTLWLRAGEPLNLMLATAFAAAAAQIKNEGMPQVVIVLIVVAPFAVRRGAIRRFGILVAGVAVAFVAAVPWLTWRATHDVPSELSLSRGLHRLRALDAFGQLSHAVRVLVHDALSPGQWLVVIPLAVLLSIAAAVVSRRAAALGVIAFLVLELAFWAWVYWSTGTDFQYRLTTSGYRVIATPLVVAALAIPLVAELAASRRRT
jgi:hypothetical protein